jgi:hypothetical protein
VTIPIRLILYISFIACIVTLPSPWTIYNNCKRFFVLFHIGIWNSSTIYLHLNLLTHPPPPTRTPLHTVPFFIVLFLAINFWVDVQRGFSMYAYSGYTLLWAIQLLSLLSFTPLPATPHFSTAFNTSLYTLYVHNCYGLSYWCSIILFSFPSFPMFHRVVPLLQTCSTYEFV